MVPLIDHAAALYADLTDYVDQVGSFVRAGLQRDDAVLVATDPLRLDALRDVLPDSAGITFVDITPVGVNPARLMPLYQDFFDGAARAGRGVTGVGEPALPGRTTEEYSEIARNEALVERAFAGGPTLNILCPYDAGALPTAMLEAAVRTHPTVHGSSTRVGHEVMFDARLDLAQLDEPLPAAPRDARTVAFGDDYHLVRDVVHELCRDARFDHDRTEDLVLAVHELATNTVRHGGTGGTLTAWTTPTAVEVEVVSGGRFTDPLVGRVRPDLVRETGRGLWLANQLCDLVQVRNTPTGTAVRVRLRLP